MIMKTTSNFIKRLVYNKETISNLSNKELNLINGGFICDKADKWTATCVTTVGNDGPPPPLRSGWFSNSAEGYPQCSSAKCANLII